jgi:hypothetical protein
LKTNKEKPLNALGRILKLMFIQKFGREIVSTKYFKDLIANLSINLKSGKDVADLWLSKFCDTFGQTYLSLNSQTEVTPMYQTKIESKRETIY